MNLKQAPNDESRVLTISAEATGFSSLSQNIINYRIRNNIVELVGINEVVGTSNATTFTFKLPFQAGVTMNGIANCFVKDKGIFLNYIAYKI